MGAQWIDGDMIKYFSGVCSKSNWDFCAKKKKTIKCSNLICESTRNDTPHKNAHD